ncbi:hypothetical protein NKH70_10755 [Mesorhizobium sp. M0991]
MLCLLGARRLEDLCCRLSITEQACLLGHHPVFGSRIAQTIDGKGRMPPLAEARRGYAAVLGRLMAPEEQELLPGLCAKGFFKPGSVVNHRADGAGRKVGLSMLHPEWGSEDERSALNSMKC